MTVGRRIGSESVSRYQWMILAHEILRAVTCVVKLSA
jgi:hypothetical protein